MAWTMCYAPCSGRERDTKKTVLLRLCVCDTDFADGRGRSNMVGRSARKEGHKCNTEKLVQVNMVSKDWESS